MFKRRYILTILTLLIVCAFFPQSGHAQACSAGSLPATITSHWTLEACGAQSANAPFSCVGSSDTVANCSGYQQSFFTSTAVQVNDTLTMMGDCDQSSGTITTNAVADNALGTGTVTTSNSGGNTSVTWVSGNTFTSGWVGGYMMIDAVNYPIATYTDNHHVTLTGNAGSKTAAVFVAGNAYTILPQTNWNFNNSGRNVQGNEFYLLGSAFAVGAGNYSAYYECVFPSGPTTEDMDTGVSLYRQTGGGASAGLDASVAWSITLSSSSASSCNGAFAGTCYLMGTSSSITPSVSNDLILGIQQNNGATMLGATPFSHGTGTTFCDNDGTSMYSSTYGGFYYTLCTNYTGTSAITFTAYQNQVDNGAFTIFALKPVALSAIPSSMAGNLTLKGTATIK